MKYDKEQDLCHACGVNNCYAPCDSYKGIRYARYARLEKIRQSKAIHLTKNQRKKQRQRR